MAKTRILVDLLSVTGARGGTETYAREIVVRLPEMLPDTELVALVNRAGRARVREYFPGEVKELKWVGADRATWAAGAVVAANRVARAVRADVIWCPANFGPITRGVPRVMTIHDVIYHELKGGPVARLVNTMTSWMMSRAAHTAHALITGSNAAARAIETHIGVPSAAITVIPHGTRDATPAYDPWTILRPLSIPRDRQIVLSTGNRLPHKNFEGLLRALAEIDPRARPLTVIPGSHGDDALAPLVARLGLQSDVILPGWVSTAQLESLYAVAGLYVCPSMSEGFGLPVIDAMRRGCTVLANDIAVLREVGGDAAIYADATSASDFGDAIVAALEEPDTARRDRGLEWSARFTWEASARRTAEVLFAATRAHI